MVGCLLMIFILGMELFCWILGMGLGEANAAPHVYLLWKVALWFIPIIGVAAIRILSSPHTTPPKRLLGVSSAAIGIASVVYWGWQTVVNQGEPQRQGGAQIASMALAVALLLVSAGISHLVPTRQAVSS